MRRRTESKMTTREINQIRQKSQRYLNLLRNEAKQSNNDENKQRQITEYANKIETEINKTYKRNEKEQFTRESSALWLQRRMGDKKTNSVKGKELRDRRVFENQLNNASKKTESSLDEDPYMAQAKAKIFYTSTQRIWGDSRNNPQRKNNNEAILEYFNNQVDEVNRKNDIIYREELEEWKKNGRKGTRPKKPVKEKHKNLSEIYNQVLENNQEALKRAYNQVNDTFDYKFTNDRSNNSDQDGSPEYLNSVMDITIII